MKSAASPSRIELIRHAIDAAMIGQPGQKMAREAFDVLLERLRLSEEVAELADHYTDCIAQAKPVDFGDEAWLLLIDALNEWRPGARQE